jgi:hypothetical protein
MREDEMETSRFLARLVGPFLVAIGAGLLINGDVYQQMAAQFLQNLGLIYLSGLLTLLAGLAIVNTHNVWTGDWRVIITIFGWLGIIGGALRIMFPQLVEAVGTGMLAQRSLIVGAWVVVLALGLWLSYVGYLEKPARSATNARRSAKAR